MAIAVPEIERRCALRAWEAIGAVVREALLRAGADPAAATALRRAEAAAAELAAIPDTPRLRRADNALLARTAPRGPNPNGPSPNGTDHAATDPAAEAFDAKIGDLVDGYRDAEMPDLASASMAMLFAWSIAMLSAHPHPAKRRKRPAGVAASGISAHAETA